MQILVPLKVGDSTVRVVVPLSGSQLGVVRAQVFTQKSAENGVLLEGLERASQSSRQLGDFQLGELRHREMIEVFGYGLRRHQPAANSISSRCAKRSQQ
jgi:hypothetical protein